MFTATDAIRRIFDGGCRHWICDRLGDAPKRHYNDCMEARGWRVADDVRAQPMLLTPVKPAVDSTAPLKIS